MTKLWNLLDWIKCRNYLHRLLNNELLFCFCFPKNGCGQSKSYPVHYMETSQLISRANQLSGFYVIGKLDIDKLRPIQWTNAINALERQSHIERCCSVFTVDCEEVPTNKCMLKVNNLNTRKKCEIRSESITKTPE